MSDREADALACQQALEHEYQLHSPPERGSLQDDFESVLPDLVVMTIRSEDPANLATMHRLRPPSRVRPVPLIAIVESPSSEWECRLLAEGADDVLRLPVDALNARQRLRRRSGSPTIGR
jgi:PleD family two-component response regulator